MRYDYERWRGFFFQAIKDDNLPRRELFLCYIKKRKFFFILYRLLEKLKAGFLGPITGLLFYLFTYLLIRFPENRKRVTMLQLEIEKMSYRDVFGRNDRIGLIYNSLSITPLSIKFLLRERSFKKFSYDLYILDIILKRYDLFVALRIIQYLAYYDRFNLEIDKKNTKRIIVFTDSNPHGRALMHLAHRKNIELCFISHGEPTEPVLPICCDLAYLLGEKSLDSYKKSRSRFGKVLYHGHKDMFKKIREIDFGQNIKIGIFLSKLTNLNEVLRLNDLLEETFKCETILIRKHPNMDLSKEEERLLLKKTKVHISNGCSIETDIEKCDLVFAGNTTAHIDILLRGCPSFYYAGFEKGFFDTYGYLEKRIILDWNKDVSSEDINSFYQSLNKKNSINYYLNIEKNSSEAIRNINEIIFK